MTGPVRRAARVLGALGLLGGVVGMIAASGEGLTAPVGVRLGAFFHLNLLGAIVSAVLGTVALAGAALGDRRVVLTASVLWLAAAVLTVVQSGREPNWLGGTAATLAFFLGVGGGLLALSIAPEGAGAELR